MSARFQELVGNAILGIDTLWGGDVMCASGVGRFIADSWFSDEPLPLAYTDPTAARVRASGGVSAKAPDRKAIQAYLERVDILGAIRALKTETPRSDYLAGLALNKSMEGAIYSQMLTHRRYPDNLFVVSDQRKPSLMMALSQ